MSSLKIHIPSINLFVGVICSLIPVYLGIPYLLILFIFIFSLLIGMNSDLPQAIIFYLILSYLIPFDFLTLSTGSGVGLVFNEYFFAGIPLYFTLPGVILRKNHKRGYTRSQKIIFYSTITLLVISNIIPGILSLIGIGGYRIRLIFLFNFLNALILFYLLSRVQIDSRLIKNVANCVIYLGVIASVFGIFQYVLKVPIIPNIGNTDFSRLNLLNMNNAVDSCPYLLVPFIMALSKLVHSKNWSNKLLVATIIIFAAILLTFSRWGLFTVSIVILLTIWKNRRWFVKRIFVVALLSSIFVPIVIAVGQDAIQSKEQNERLTSAGNLYVRVYLWGLAATAINDNPWGYGFGNSTDAMFSKESEFQLLEENAYNSVDTFQEQSVHQFFLDYMMSLGALFGIILLFFFVTLYRESVKVSKIVPVEFSYFYIAIKLSTIALFIFYLQNVGSQMFYLFLFLGFFTKNYYSKNAFELS